MKNRKLIVLILILFLSLLITNTVSAGNGRIDFTFTEVCDYDTLVTGREIYNGQGNELVKNITVTCSYIGSIDQYTGTAYLDLNVNTVGNGSVWLYAGKVRVETIDGGVWNLNCLYPWPSPDAQCVGHGEGKYKGQQIFIRYYPHDGGSGYIVDNK